MEQEVVHMCLDLFHAGKNGAGNMTSGGTESILMAVKAAKNRAKTNSRIKTPYQVVLPESAHPAFHKACDYFDLEAVIVPLKADYRVDEKALELAITDHTILIVASAPQYPQGVVDDIEAIALLAKRHDVLFHVDACVGGFVLPFMYNRFHFDFSVDGVTSMSADIHKYGYASKGCSVILYKEKSLRRHQFYVYTDWPGGMYGSPSILGTRPAGAIAVAWSVLNHLGSSGYQRLVAKKMDLFSRFLTFFSDIPDVEVVGEPDMCICSIQSHTIDIYQLGDELYVAGWLLDRQQSPASLHLSISPNHEKYFDEFCQDFHIALANTKKMTRAGLQTKIQISAAKGLKKVLPSKIFDKVKKAAIQNANPNDKRSAAMYGLIGELKGTGEVEDLIKDYLDKLFE
jgi:glutamate/tyrosine decarboxylase-like PLP-dependent enzyme